MMMTANVLVALALIPAPQKMSVTDGAFASNLVVSYVRDAKIPAEGYRLKGSRGTDPSGGVVVVGFGAAGW